MTGRFYRNAHLTFQINDTDRTMTIRDPGARTKDYVLILTDNECEFRLPHNEVWMNLLGDDPAWGIDEYSIDLLDPNSNDYAQVGALTSSPLLAVGLRRDEVGNIKYLTELYYFPNYQVESELETLLRTGEVKFMRAETNE